MCQAGQSHIVQINRAQSRRARPGDVGCGLQDVELCPQARCEIAFGYIERFVRGLYVFCFAFEHTLGLLKIEKRAAHFRGDTPPRCCQSLHGCLAPGARRLHPPFSREPVEDVPRCVYPHNTAVIKFWTDLRITLAIHFIAGKGTHMWTHRALIQYILSVFDLNVFLTGFDDWAICVRPGQTII